MRIRVLAACSLLFVFIAGCSEPQTPAAYDSTRAGSSTVSVVASAYPLAYAADEVGKAQVVVKDLTPPGTEPHDIELTPRDIGALQAAELVVMVGGGFQPSIEKAVAGLPIGSRETYDALAGLTPIIGGDAQGGRDPHFWLDPMLMAEAGEGIAERLIRLDPDARGTYSRNLEQFKGELSRIDSEFKAGLKTCKRRTIIVSHAAFGYLTDRYELTQVSLSGLSPHAEPTPASLEIARRVARETGASTIFVEPGGDTAAAEILAREVGGSTAQLDPIEIQQQGKDYLAAMRGNLDSLRRALECE